MFTLAMEGGTRPAWAAALPPWERPSVTADPPPLPVDLPQELAPFTTIDLRTIYACTGAAALP